MERAFRPCPSPRFLLQHLCPGTFVLPMLNCKDGIEKPFKSSLKTSRDSPFPPLQAYPPPRPCGWAGGRVVSQSSARSLGLGLGNQRPRDRQRLDDSRLYAPLVPRLGKGPDKSSPSLLSTQPLPR